MQQQQVQSPFEQIMNMTVPFSAELDSAAPPTTTTAAGKPSACRQRYNELPTAFAIASAAPAPMAMAMASPLGRAGSGRDGDKELEDIIESLFSDELRSKGPNVPLPLSPPFAYPDAYPGNEPSKGEGAPSECSLDGSVTPPGNDSLSAHAEAVALSSGLLPSSDLLDCASHNEQQSSPAAEEQSDASSTLSNCRFSTTELLDLGEGLLD